MKGFQVTFFTNQGRRHGHKLVHDWLMEVGKSLGITGITVVMGAEGVGRNGKLHSAHFFEYADQPIEVSMALTEDLSRILFDLLEKEEANLFYISTPVEYGVVGAPRNVVG